jgi:hypothetical protein
MICTKASAVSGPAPGWVINHRASQIVRQETLKPHNTCASRGLTALGAVAMIEVRGGAVWYLVGSNRPLATNAIMLHIVLDPESAWSA